MRKIVLLPLFLFLATLCQSQDKNRDPQKARIVTSDIANFWIAFDKAGRDIDPKIFGELYLQKGSPGLQDFMKGRIKSADNLSKVIRRHVQYYSSIRQSTDSINFFEEPIRKSLMKLKTLYPEATFPPIYFVVGALNSGGTSSDNGLIIGLDMYGLTSHTPKEELNDWLRTVIKPVNQVPHIVAHELIHFQQQYDGEDLLSASIKEGSADFIAELISGKHINQHVHDFADPKEKELWEEFRQRMDKKDYTGWLYSSTPGRPNDLGYWIGYKIARAYYDQAADKQQAIKDILMIKDFKAFLEKSGYAKKFK